MATNAQILDNVQKEKEIRIGIYSNINMLLGELEGYSEDIIRVFDKVDEYPWVISRIPAIIKGMQQNLNTLSKMDNIEWRGFYYGHGGSNSYPGKHT